MVKTDCLEHREQKESVGIRAIKDRKAIKELREQKVQRE